MDYKVDTVLREIAIQILAEGRSEEEWAEIESDDMFQSGNCVGGFDADEMAFCFSVYLDKKEYWFQITLDEVSEIANGLLETVDARLAE